MIKHRPGGDHAGVGVGFHELARPRFADVDQAVANPLPGRPQLPVPDRLDFMRKVEPDVIVPYWMTLHSAWRLIVPGGFLDAPYGERWKAKLEKRMAEGSVRSRYLPWFAWI
ncbi:hypothetical protein OH799_07485 [Nocardia sp. NBC_00881]|uniref:hypothetical protein n=1 Tax=Nocardia sp. NBC_00881 TaxID=2975995 RepID=UPI0038690791|nr:hypothetical protein OH799_07485 [Nocardia sp. NBC_00881]